MLCIALIQTNQNPGFFILRPGELLVPTAQRSVSFAVQVKVGFGIWFAGVELFPGKQNMGPFFTAEGGIADREQGAAVFRDVIDVFILVIPDLQVGKGS